MVTNIAALEDKMELKLLVLAFVLVTVSAQMKPEDSFGRCTMQKFTDRQGQCTRKFLAALRKSPGADCLKKFERSLACTRKWIRFCLKGTVPQYVLDATEQGATQGDAVKSMKEIYCGNKDIKLPMPDIDVEKNGCDKEFLPRLKTYLNNLYQKFRRNRSDPNLCNEFQQMQKKIKELIKEHCKAANADSLTSIFDDQGKLFCS